MWFGCTTTEINQAMESLPGLLAQTGQTGGGLSQADIVAGLKSALSVGSGKASTGLHKTDAFFRNSAIKILFPAEAAKVKSILDKAGLDVSAIKSMTIQDGLNILFGSDGAATSYLKRTTSQQLVSSFRPSITRSLSKVNATKHWSDVMQAYNQIPFMKQINPDLSSYVTQKALDGIFYAVAKEEKNIRDNPKARVTGILQKVFGYRDSKK
jgi:hypothetical protein